MCGIIGILGTNNNAVPRVIDALQRLEYRGYDSAGVAVLDTEANIQVRRAVGKLQALRDVLADSPIEGNSGIGHTRWATHGEPSKVNAHPHATKAVALVHNGIIENFQALRQGLADDGIVCTGDTDTEIVVRLLDRELKSGKSHLDAFQATLNKLEGAYALAVIFKDETDLMLGARKGSPLVAGIGDSENYLGSDALALTHLTNRVIYLEEGDIAEVTHEQVFVRNSKGEIVDREVSHSHLSGALIDRGNYRHFMQKEIYEQPTVVGQTLGRYLDPNNDTIKLPDTPFDLATVTKITLVACGTSFYAAQVARYWIEKLARISVDVDIASEFRYRDPVYAKGGLAIFISQSGETADTLAAMRHAKEAGQHVAAIVNVPLSSMAREADVVFPTYAGPEIGVASTKAFTCQLAVLAAFAIKLGSAHGKIDQNTVTSHVRELERVPALISKILNDHDNLQLIAENISTARDILFVGRGVHSPIAMEGALKLKELSYIHAEGYAAGELKHGPIALIDDSVPVIGIAPSDELADKTVSNLQEIAARKGQVFVISDTDHTDDSFKMAQTMPEAGLLASPIIYAIPVQLLAYYTAVAKGTDVDQPRNLAKAVTVE